MTTRLASLIALGLVTAACETSSACEEDTRAQVLPFERVIEVDGVQYDAEVADGPAERERGWRHRRCGREALLLVPDEPGPLPLWGCELVDPVDALFVRGGEIVLVVRELSPCPSPCGNCELFGEDLPVDAIVELPHDPDRAAMYIDGV